MQILITHGHLARSRVLQFTPAQLVLFGVSVVLGLILVSGALYHFVFLKAVRDGWPVVSQLVTFVFRDEAAQRERFMRQNLDAIAQKVGEMQAKLVKLEAMSERVSGMAGVKPDELKPLQRATGRGGQGGPYVPLSQPTRQELDELIGKLGLMTEQHTDVFTLIESRLLESRLDSLMVPSTRPVDGQLGSGFGFRTDPFSGHPALHTGLDFTAETGTPIVAAAGGVVVDSSIHPMYGRQIEIDHGKGLATRYAHASKVLVKEGDIVRKGQTIALVGSTGRSTGPHLHFEVLVGGVPQNPARFLAGPTRVGQQR